MIKHLLKILLVLVFLIFTFKTQAQSDTSKKAQTYIQVYYALTNTAGTLGGKSNLSVEVGKQWNVFSLGVDVGKTTLERITGRDTSFYFEIRPNLNIFQQGKFTNTLTVGVGYIVAAPNNFLTELTSGIEYSATDRLHLNINFGQFYYSGRYTASSATFFGVSASYYFLPYNNRSSIIKPK